MTFSVSESRRWSIKDFPAVFNCARPELTVSGNDDIIKKASELETAMAELKTKASDRNVMDFLKTVQDGQRRQDCLTLLEMMKKATRSQPTMWGTSIVGFGHYHYVYESGREGDWFITGFSPRKQNLTLYVMGGFAQHTMLLKQLGKWKTGKGCLYINKLQDIHLPTLRKLIERSVKVAREMART